jgi:hypothetical protein
MEVNRNAEFSLKRNWFKSMPGLNILEKPLEAQHRSPVFQVSGLLPPP